MRQLFIPSNSQFVMAVHCKSAQPSQCLYAGQRKQPGATWVFSILWVNVCQRGVCSTLHPHMLRKGMCVLELLVAIMMSWINRDLFLLPVHIDCLQHVTAVFAVAFPVLHCCKLFSHLLEGCCRNASCSAVLLVSKAPTHSVAVTECGAACLGRLLSGPHMATVG